MTTLRSYDDICVGDRASITRVVSENLVRVFADVSGDHNPLHVNDLFAGRVRWGQRLAHGALTSAFISAALTELSAGWIYLRQESVFLNPVFLSDTVTAVVQVQEKQPRRRMVVSTEVRRGGGDLVIRGSAVMQEISEVFAAPRAG